MRPHQKLEAWSKAIELVTDIYKSSEHFPREERYGLTGQIRRAAVSIPANLAEGAGRRSQKEFAYFLSNSQGSASELETELIIANRLGYLDETTFARLISQLERIGRLITEFRATLVASRVSPTRDRRPLVTQAACCHLPFTIHHLPGFKLWPFN